MQNHIHWYPGHIAKAERELKEKLNLVDVVLEIIDARIPYSSLYKDTVKLCQNKPRLILMNKTDLSDKNQNKLWAQKISKITGQKVILTNLKTKNDVNTIISNVLNLSKGIMQKRLEKGLLIRPTRVMVIGMPNVGKSTIINRLVKRQKAKTGAKAGVTRNQQWVRINEKIELLDTPGIIPTVQNDQFQALKLALVSSIGENAYDKEYAADGLIKILLKLYNDEFRKYFDFDNEEDVSLDIIAKKKNWILKGDKPDTVRCASILLKAFRDGGLGSYTLDDIKDYELI